MNYKIKPHKHINHHLVDEQGNFTVGMHGSPAMILLVLNMPGHSNGLNIEDLQENTSYPREAVEYGVKLLEDDNFIQPLTDGRWASIIYAGLG